MTNVNMLDLMRPETHLERLLIMVQIEIQRLRQQISDVQRLQQIITGVKIIRQAILHEEQVQ